MRRHQATWCWSRLNWQLQLLDWATLRSIQGLRNPSHTPKSINMAFFESRFTPLVGQAHLSVHFFYLGFNDWMNIWYTSGILLRCLKFAESRGLILLHCADFVGNLLTSTRYQNLRNCERQMRPTAVTGAERHIYKCWIILLPSLDLHWTICGKITDIYLWIPSFCFHQVAGTKATALLYNYA